MKEQIDWRSKYQVRPTEAAKTIKALEALLPPGPRREELIAKELEKDAKRARVREQRRELRDDKRARVEALKWQEEDGEGGKEED